MSGDPDSRPALLVPDWATPDTTVRLAPANSPTCLSRLIPSSNRGVPMATPPIRSFHTVARMAGNIDVDHPPASARLGEDPWRHSADDPELVNTAVECREGEGLHVDGG